jgi:hypothetical protein
MPFSAWGSGSAPALALVPLRDVSASSGFEQRQRRYTRTVETSDELARFAAHHLPFYEKLHAQRLDVAAWEPMAGS